MVYFNKQLQLSITDLYVDWLYVCLSGVGGALGRLVYVLPLSRIPNLPLPCTIVHLEMINVFIGLNLWKHKLTGKAVVIYCDNMAVVWLLTLGHSWDPFLGTAAIIIWLVTATYDIDLAVHHIPGKSNGIADSLSRWFGGGLNQAVVNISPYHEWCSITDDNLNMNLIIECYSRLRFCTKFSYSFTVCLNVLRIYILKQGWFLLLKRIKPRVLYHFSLEWIRIICYTVWLYDYFLSIREQFL